MKLDDNLGAGFYYREGRGWCLTHGEPLTDAHGRPLKAKDTRDATLKESYARAVLTCKQSAGLSPTVVEICQLYPDHCQRTDSAATTYGRRAGTLFDLGPVGQHDSANVLRARTTSNKVHQGFASKLVTEFIPLVLTNY